MINLPNFLIAGAAKSGTTSLYYWLSQHPQVYLSPIKEPCFLCYASRKPAFEVNEDIVLDFDRYCSLFDGAEAYPYRGEATAIYLYHYRETIENIRKYIPDHEALKIIMILRNPVERAFSQYMMNVRDVRDLLSFEEALDAEPERIRNGWNSDFFYTDRGFYYQQVKAYLKAFREVRVYLFDDLKNDPQALFMDLLDFLGVRQSADVDIHKIYNFSGRPRHPWVNRFIKQNTLPKRLVKCVLPRAVRNRLFENVKNRIYSYNLVQEKMPEPSRIRLKRIFREDVEKLSELINRDLSVWIRKE